MTQPIATETFAADEEPPSSGSESLSDSEIEIETIVDAGVDNPLSIEQMCQAVRLAAESRGFHAGSIGVRITNDETIRELNAQHLGHDYATDVISFGYAADTPTIEGELVASVDTALRESESANWPTTHELMLYIVHGVLHITGMDDHDPADRAAMRAAEQTVFLKLGIDEITRCGADGNDDDRKGATQS